ncbi:aspartate/glutamate racemase family protein [Olleya marilimosa]|uniref:Aspartate/glutamate racemase family protein n=1 Tax=Olleya marilimosa TaxID=272164 RepID=A0ABR8LP10_9FLAO|nr:aspartate/glutamate racemase family protein [Olleya marilimosa]MBD3861950.1 aspartate/glutamate racemase family protein [Olleya marilimosa]MBD3889451.1 aspartate/glutamate racemase family protein [Olleya marilimosa]
MSTLGVLGLGSYSTLFYIKTLNAMYNKKYGGFSTCPFKLLNVDFDAINKLLPNTSNALDTIVKTHLNTLDALKVDNILVPNITLHETIDRLQIKTNVIHAIQETISKITGNNHVNITIFGTLYTMQSNYLTSQFTAQNINIVKASDADMQLIDNLRIAVYNGDTNPKQLNIFNDLLNKYTKNGIVVLACTELSVINTSNSKLVYDMARIQIQAAIKSI